jgi:hypothetical protein
MGSHDQMGTQVLDPASPVPYVLGAVIAFLAFVAVVRWLRVRAGHGIAIGVLASIAFAVLGMIKLRCTLSSAPCGFMSFTGGFTWHFFVALLLFLAVWSAGSWLGNASVPAGWGQWMAVLGRAAAPLIGLWLAVCWETLPVHLIHPPQFGGICPSLPMICHDTPLAGRGGLGFWTAPFALWAMVLLVSDVVTFVKSKPVTHRGRLE